MRQENPLPLFVFFLFGLGGSVQWVDLWSPSWFFLRPSLDSYGKGGSEEVVQKPWHLLETFHTFLNPHHAVFIEKEDRMSLHRSCDYVNLFDPCI